MPDINAEYHDKVAEFFLKHVKFYGQELLKKFTFLRNSYAMDLVREAPTLDRLVKSSIINNPDKEVEEKLLELSNQYVILKLKIENYPKKYKVFADNYRFSATNLNAEIEQRKKYRSQLYSDLESNTIILETLKDQARDLRSKFKKIKAAVREVYPEKYYKACNYLKYNYFTKAIELEAQVKHWENYLIRNNSFVEISKVNLKNLTKKAKNLNNKKVKLDNQINQEENYQSKLKFSLKSIELQLKKGPEQVEAEKDKYEAVKLPKNIILLENYQSHLKSVLQSREVELEKCREKAKKLNDKAIKLENQIKEWEVLQNQINSSVENGKVNLEKLKKQSNYLKANYAKVIVTATKYYVKALEKQTKNLKTIDEKTVVAVTKVYPKEDVAVRSSYKLKALQLDIDIKFWEKYKSHLISEALRDDYKKAKAAILGVYPKVYQSIKSNYQDKAVKLSEKSNQLEQQRSSLNNFLESNERELKKLKKQAKNLSSKYEEDKATAKKNYAEDCKCLREIKRKGDKINFQYKTEVRKRVTEENADVIPYTKKIVQIDETIATMLKELGDKNRELKSAKGKGIQELKVNLISCISVLKRSFAFALDPTRETLENPANYSGYYMEEISPFSDNNLINAVHTQKEKIMNFYNEINLLLLPSYIDHKCPDYTETPPSYTTISEATVLPAPIFQNINLN